MEKYIVIASLAAAAAAFAGLAVLIFLCSKERINLAERVLRSRWLGGILGAAALAWCVPQIEAVIWSSWVPYLWYMAAAALILSVLYLDNVAARGFAGLLIMGAYSFLDMSFDCKLAMYITGALPAWVWGSIGIIIAAKPCYLRDFLRLGAEKSFWRFLAAFLAAVTVLFLIGSILIYCKKAV